MTVPPNLGPALGDAARLACGAHRLLVATVLRIEAAEELLAPTETISFANMEAVDLAGLLAESDLLASNLQRIADEYGHAEVRRRFG